MLASRPKRPAHTPFWSTLKRCSRPLPTPEGRWTTGLRHDSTSLETSVGHPGCQARVEHKSSLFARGAAKPRSLLDALLRRRGRRRGGRLVLGGDQRGEPADRRPLGHPQVDVGRGGEVLPPAPGRARARVPGPWPPGAPGAPASGPARRRCGPTGRPSRPSPAGAPDGRPRAARRPGRPAPRGRPRAARSPPPGAGSAPAATPGPRPPAPARAPARSPRRRAASPPAAAATPAGRAIVTSTATARGQSRCTETDATQGKAAAASRISSTGGDTMVPPDAASSIAATSASRSGRS